MKNIIPVICLIIGASAGFASGEWKGEADTLKAYAVAQAPGVDPSYISAVSGDAVYRTRAKIDTKGMR